MLRWLNKQFLKLRKKNPYQDLNDDYQSIFIHIPKNAGISVEESLFGQKVGHKTIRQFEAYDSRKLDEYFKFTVVRNPYDRLVSAFHFLKNGGQNDDDKAWALKNLKGIDDFSDFLVGLNDNAFATRIMRWQHFRPQYHYLIDSTDEVRIDFVLRFENLENDFARLVERLKLENVTLQHKNKSNRKHYMEYYDDGSRKRVHELYERDFRLFYDS